MFISRRYEETLLNAFKFDCAEEGEICEADTADIKRDFQVQFFPNIVVLS